LIFIYIVSVIISCVQQKKQLSKRFAPIGSYF